MSWLKNRGALAVLVVFCLAVGTESQAAEAWKSWEISGQAVSGAVGDTVTITFGLRNTATECKKAHAMIQTEGSARTNVIFTGVNFPAQGFVTPEQVQWPHDYVIDHGEVKQFSAQAKIGNGSVGEVIEGFKVGADCNGTGGYFYRQVVGSSTVTVTAPTVVETEPAEAATPSPTPLPPPASNTASTPPPGAVATPINEEELPTESIPSPTPGPTPDPTPESTVPPIVDHVDDSRNVSTALYLVGALATLLVLLAGAGVTYFLWKQSAAPAVLQEESEVIKSNDSPKIEPEENPENLWPKQS